MMHAHRMLTPQAPSASMRSLSMLPPVVWPLLVEVLQYIQGFTGPRDIDALEFMSGQAEISQAAARQGRDSVGYDK
eukprot:10896606-Lingulodinium_polyedra.AAC.1